MKILKRLYQILFVMNLLIGLYGTIYMRLAHADLTETQLFLYNPGLWFSLAFNFISAVFLLWLWRKIG